MSIAVEPTGEHVATPKSKVQFKKSMQAGNEDVFCVKYDPTDSKVAYECGDGYLRVYDVNSGETKEFLGNPKAKVDLQMPITCLCWKPIEGSTQTSTITSCSADGFIYEWELDPINLTKDNTWGQEDSMVSEMVSRFKEEGSKGINCMDYTPDGKFFITAGGDYSIRMYDDNTKTVVSRLKGKMAHNVGHSNRIFTVLFNPNDTNMILSGSWDNTVMIWDIRQGMPVEHLYGYSISGESVDIKNDKILIGSFSKENNLRLFDLKNLAKELTSIKASSCVYSAKFTKTEDDYIVAGGCDSNEVKIFRKLDEDHYKSMSKISNMQTGCLAVDCAHHSNKFVIGCTDGSIKLYDIE